MEPFATLTVDRGDRPQFLEFCKRQINRFTIQPKHQIFVTEPPTSNDVDLTLRMKKGISAAKALGIDIIYVIESDDFYPENYIEDHWIGGHDFIGSTRTIYYNLFNKSYVTHQHPKHSSLFCTAFRISALDGFIWPPDNTAFLDINIWRHATRRNAYSLTDEPKGVGIKHGIGRVAGNGHAAFYKNIDTDRSYLKTLVDKEAFNFYKSIASF